jgi:hypothetical protein
MAINQRGYPELTAGTEDRHILLPKSLLVERAIERVRNRLAKQVGNAPNGQS